MLRRYIRHYTGTVHSVNAEDFARHLAQARLVRYDDPTTEIAREATPDEVAAYWAKQGFVYLPETDEALTESEAAARQPAPAPAPAPATPAKASAKE